jgi:hypothetical protein
MEAFHRQPILVFLERLIKRCLICQTWYHHCICDGHTWGSTRRTSKSMALPPKKRVMSEYCTIVLKMHEDAPNATTTHASREDAKVGHFTHKPRAVTIKL